MALRLTGGRERIGGGGRAGGKRFPSPPLDGTTLRPRLAALLECRRSISCGGMRIGAVLQPEMTFGAPFRDRINRINSDDDDAVGQWRKRPVSMATSQRRNQEPKVRKQLTNG